MQLYALDNDQQIVFANTASKKCDYYCIECHQGLRLRGGLHRQIHFYHLRHNTKCKQHAKGMIHLQIQMHLYDLFSFECSLEYRFPDIGRIADCVWWPKKLIFEIQCSPISSTEVHERIEDYSRTGLDLVWILHDQTFNKWRLSATENLLLKHSHYFTNMNAKGEGIFFDQWAVIKKGCREKKSTPLEIDLRNPTTIPKPKQRLRRQPKALQLRHKHWRIAFKEDWSFQKWDVEKRSIRELAHSAYSFLSQSYKQIFKVFLERACR